MSMQMFQMMTDEELVKHFAPETDRERLLFDRLDSPADRQREEELEGELASVRREWDDMERQLEEKEDELSKLEEYAEELYSALHEAGIAKELLDDNRRKLIGK